MTNVVCGLAVDSDGLHKADNSSSVVRLRISFPTRSLSLWLACRRAAEVWAHWSQSFCCGPQGEVR